MRSHPVNAVPPDFGPVPFIFTPDGAVGPSPAFSVPFKALTSAIIAASAAGFIQGWWIHRATGGGWFFAALLLLLYTGWHILNSTTRIYQGGLHQTWIWDKHLELRELAYGKLIRVRGLEWLIAPRLYVRTLTGKFAVFYAASPDMINEFERMARELKAFRSVS